MQNASFLQDLAVVLLAAGFAAVVFHHFRQPKVLGYILAGLLLGPHTPPFTFIRNEASIHMLADLGVIFLMFSLGLEFNLRKFRRVGAPAAFSAVLDVGVMMWLGYMLGRQLGWSTVECLFLAGMMCDSSTTILAKTLQEMGHMRERFASLMVGITVVEDVLAVSVIAILSGVALTGSLQAGLIAGRLWQLILFFIAVITVGLLTLPRLLDYLHRLKNDEVLVVPLLGICFGVSLLAAQLEISLAMGAVLVGAIASESRAIQRIEALIDPLRHAFTAVFFVAIGLLLNPATLLAHWVPVLLVTLVIIAGKFINNVVGALLTGHDTCTALRVGSGLAQVGEFTFIIAALGVSMKATSNAVYQVGVGAAILTTIINPYLMRAMDRVAMRVEHSPRCQRWTSYFRLYNEWAERIRRQRPSSVIRRAVNRSVWIIVINTLLITAAIISAGYLARRPLAVFPSLAARPGILAAVLWLLAMGLCLPLYVANVRKLQAVGMILAELVLPATLTAAWARTLRGFVANSILVAGTVALLVLTFILSSTMLPSREVLGLLMIATALIGILRYRRMVKLYSQAQIAIGNMLKEHENEPVGPAVPDRFVLSVESSVLGPASPVVGQELRTIQLRTRTGATVVGIDRKGVTVTNPAPDERLQGGDRVFLLGSPDQIEAALSLFAPVAAP